MRAKRLVLMMFVVLPLVAVDADAQLFGKKDSADTQRQEVLQMHDETLARLYKEKSAAKEMVENSVGYAVFSNTGVNVLIVSTASGKGVAHDNESNHNTYMNMFSAGGGLGVGLKKFSAVFVFHSRETFNQFVDKGWNFTGQVDAAATTDAEGGEQAGSMETTVGLNEGVTVYQMTKKGLALQATLQGTKYWQDDELN